MPPVATVWNLISDFNRMPEVEPAVPADEGSGTVAGGHQDHQPQSPRDAVLADHVGPHRGDTGEEVGVRGQRERHRVELRVGPTATGTRVTGARRAANGVVKPISAFLTRTVLGGMDVFEHELVDGMNASLSRIKAAAERR